MKRLSAAIGALLLVLLVAVPVSAGPPSGSTTLQGDARSGSTVLVDVTVHTTAPVVAYEYAIQNECTFPKKGSTLQHDDIVYWTFVAGGDPAATMTIDLGTVPQGSKCKVFILHGNVVVKGSVTSYTVLAGL